MQPKKKLAVWKFASCDGCQLSLLDCEDEFLTVADAVDIAYFLEATSTVKEGPYDLSLVEGSVTTPHDAERIQWVRRISKKVVTIGACATSGGIQALRNFQNHDEMRRLVYAQPEFIDALTTSTPIAAHIPVDFELRGCPVDKMQLLEVVNALVHGRKPNVRAHTTCIECKMRGTVCVMVSQGMPCLGPVTHAGCGALCPTYHRGCFGCFGPSEDPKTRPLQQQLLQNGMSRKHLNLLFQTFNANAPPFREIVESSS